MLVGQSSGFTGGCLTYGYSFASPQASAETARAPAKAVRRGRNTLQYYVMQARQG